MPSHQGDLTAIVVDEAVEQGVEALPASVELFGLVRRRVDGWTRAADVLASVEVHQNGHRYPQPTEAAGAIK